MHTLFFYLKKKNHLTATYRLATSPCSLPNIRPYHCDPIVLPTKWQRYTVCNQVLSKMNVIDHVNDHVRLLGVTISSDLSPVKHVGTISSSCFYWLRQIRRIRRSLDAESAKTLVHAFITLCIDGCNTVLAGSPRTITDRLQRLLNAAARVVSNTGKFDRGLTHLLHSELHWLDVPQQEDAKDASVSECT